MKRSWKSQKGQSIVEAVLLMVLLVGLGTFVSKKLKETEVVSKIIEGPWKSLDNMIQHGHWTDNKGEAIANNPNQNEKRTTPTP